MSSCKRCEKGIVISDLYYHFIGYRLCIDCAIAIEIWITGSDELQSQLTQHKATTEDLTSEVAELEADNKVLEGIAAGYLKAYNKQEETVLAQRIQIDQHKATLAAVEEALKKYADESRWQDWGDRAIHDTVFYCPNEDGFKIAQEALDLIGKQKEKTL